MSELSKKVAKAIERYKTFEPEEGYYLAFSGGKDSVVIKALAEMRRTNGKLHNAKRQENRPNVGVRIIAYRTN